MKLIVMILYHITFIVWIVVFGLWIMEFIEAIKYGKSISYVYCIVMLSLDVVMTLLSRISWFLKEKVEENQ